MASAEPLRDGPGAWSHDCHALEQYECDETDPGPGYWEADAYSEPEDDGLRDGWETACDEFFNGYVGGDLYWGDTVEVGQLDCEAASSY